MHAIIILVDAAQWLERLIGHQKFTGCAHTYMFNLHSAWA